MNSLLATERRRHEDEGQEVEGRSLRQQPLAPVGKWEWNLLTKNYSWCDEMYRIFNVPREQSPLRTGTFFNCVHPEDRERVVRSFGQALVGKEPYRVEHRLLLPDGSVRLVRGEAEVRLDQSGRPVSMLGTIRDLTGLSQAGRASDE